MLIFHLFRNASLTLKRQYLCQYLAEKECYISKSKLILCEWNAFYFSEITFIDFMLHEIKQCIVFFGTPGICIYIYIVDNFETALNLANRLQV